MKITKIFQSIKYKRVAKRILQGWILRDIQKDLVHYMNIVLKVNKKIDQKRFQVINDSMRIKSVKKTQFASLNDKPFFFQEGIVSVQFGHFLLNKVHAKIKKKQKRNV